MTITTQALARLVLSLDNKRRGGIGGQMITEWKCALCGSDEMHSNTCTPLICRECQAEVKFLALQEPSTAEEKK